MKVNIN